MTTTINKPQAGGLAHIRVLSTPQGPVIAIKGTFSDDSRAPWYRALRTIGHGQNVLVDCQELESVSSTGLSLWLAAKQEIESQGARFGLFNLNGLPLEFLKHFHLYDRLTLPDLQPPRH